MRNDVIVRKLLDYTEKILAYCRGCDYDSFCANSLLAEACVFNLSQMGELAHKADTAYTQAHGITNVLLLGNIDYFSQDTFDPEG